MRVEERVFYISWGGGLFGFVFIVFLCVVFVFYCVVFVFDVGLS